MPPPPPAHRSRAWPAGPARHPGSARGAAAAAAPGTPSNRPGDGPFADDRLAGLRATLNAFCYFFDADTGDAPPQP